MDRAMSEYSVNFMARLSVSLLYPEKAFCKDVNRGTIENLQRTRIFKASHRLKVHDVHFKFLSSISV